ncbi:MAG: hypothetical protein K9L59_08040 [Desulfobacterales bacterium]|nr:hypothetical protein [Desulfobacterales bacterium]
MVVVEAQFQQKPARNSSNIVVRVLIGLDRLGLPGLDSFLGMFRHIRQRPKRFTVALPMPWIWPSNSIR